jgi:hypothetical protein
MKAGGVGNGMEAKGGLILDVGAVMAATVLVRRDVMVC